MKLIPEFFQNGPCLFVEGLPLNLLKDTAPVVKLEFPHGALEGEKSTSRERWNARRD